METKSVSDSNDPNKRHRATEEYHFTCGYIICWIGILIYYGSLSTSKSPVSAREI